MNFKELKEVNSELFDNNSKLLEKVKIGTPWVETLILYIKNCQIKSPASTILINIASTFEECDKKGVVIYDGHFKASRLPSIEEVKTALELCNKRNRISKLISECMRKDGCKVINFLSKECHEKILNEIDFEISSIPVLYYLLGYTLVDSREYDCIYGVTTNGSVQMMKDNGEVYSVSDSELCGVKNVSPFGLSNLF